MLSQCFIGKDVRKQRWTLTVSAFDELNTYVKAIPVPHQRVMEQMSVHLGR